MSQESIELFKSEKKTMYLFAPTAKKVFKSTRGLKGKLLPILQIDGRVADEKMAGMLFTFCVQSIQTDRVNFLLNDDFTYSVIDDIATLKKIEDFSEYDYKKGYLTTEINVEETITYKSTEVFNDSKLLIEERDASHSYDQRRTFEYEKQEGIFLPSVRRTLKYISGQWVERKKTEFIYNSDGFISEYLFSRHSQVIKFEEELKYDNKGKFIHISKSNQLPIHPEILYKYPFTAKIDTKKNKMFLRNEIVTLDPDSMYSKVESYAKRDFWNMQNGFVKYQLGLTAKDITMNTIYEGDKPIKISYELEIKGDGSSMKIEDIKSEENKVSFVSKKGTLLTEMEHKGSHIIVTEKQEGKDTKEKRYAGFLTLQQTMVCYISNFQFFCEDFESETSSSCEMNGTFYGRRKHKYAEDGDHHVRKSYDYYRNTPSREGYLMINEPMWLQSEDVPLDRSGKKMQFVAQLFHGELFGCLYLFYSAEEKMVSQIFQCT